MAENNYDYVLADLTTAEKEIANQLISHHRNLCDARKQYTKKRQFGLENIHPSAFKHLVDDSLVIVNLAPPALQNDLTWLNWEILVSEITGRLEGMIITDPVKVLSNVTGIVDARLERFNPDSGRNVIVDMKKGIVEIDSEITDSDPSLNVTNGNSVPYGIVLQCGLSSNDSEDTHYQIDDMGSIELNDAMQACYTAIGQLHQKNAVEGLANHVVFMRCLKQLKFNTYEYAPFLFAIHDTYTRYFERKKSHEQTMRNKGKRNERHGFTETEMMMRALMTPENIHKAQQKLAYSLEKRGLKQNHNVIDITTFKQEQISEQINAMFEPDHPDTW